MDDVNISARIPKSVARDLQLFMETETLERSASIRKLLAQGLNDWKQERALKLLGDGKISFTKAAELAGMTVWDFSEIVRQNEVIWIRCLETMKTDVHRGLE